MTERTCTVCKKPQPLTGFTKNVNGPGGYNCQCKACRKVYKREFVQRFKDGAEDSSIAERFWKKVDKESGPTHPALGKCWMWTGAVTRWRGAILYKGRVDTAHRVSVILDGREIPHKMVVDHMCMVGLCVNPAHLRVVTQKINSRENNNSPFAKNAQKTHCKEGHEYTPENTYLKPKAAHTSAAGWKVGTTTARVCLTCQPKFRALAQSTEQYK